VQTFKENFLLLNVCFSLSVAYLNIRPVKRGETWRREMLSLCAASKNSLRAATVLCWIYSQYCLTLVYGWPQPMHPTVYRQ